MESRSATIHRKMPIPARQLPITGCAHKAGNGRRPLRAATAIARSVRRRRRGNGSTSARPNCCRFPTTTSSSPCRPRRPDRVPEQGRRLRPPVQRRRRDADHASPPTRSTSARASALPPSCTPGASADPPSARPLSSSPAAACRLTASAGSPASRASSCPCASCRRLFRRLFLEGLEPPPCAASSASSATSRRSPTSRLRRALTPLRQAPIGRLRQAALRWARAVLAYLARYTHRVAIANSQAYRPRRR